MSEHVFVVGRLLRFAQFERGDDIAVKVIAGVMGDVIAFE